MNSLNSQEQQYFQTALNNLPDAFFHEDTKGNFIYVNLAAEKLTGFSKKELLAMNKSELFSEEVLKEKPLDNSPIEKDINQIRYLRRKNGSEIPIEMHSRRIKDGTYQSVVRDISTRTRIKDDLLENQQVYKDLFEKSQDAILFIENGKFSDCNQASLDLLGYSSRNSVINRSHSDLSPEYQSDGKNSFEKSQEMLEIATRKGSHRFEWEFLRADGSIIPVGVSLTLISKDNYHVVFHTIWRDITLRRNDELIKSNLYRFTKFASNATSTHEIHSALYQSISELIPVEFYHFYEYNSDTNSLVTRFSITSVKNLTCNINFKNSPEQKVLTSQKPLYLNKTDFKNLIKQAGVPNPYSMLPIFWFGFPIQLPEEKKGVLVFASFSDKLIKFPIDTQIIESFIDQLSLQLKYLLQREKVYQNELKYRTIFEESPIGIFQFSGSGLITEVNKKFVEIIGSSREALIGFNMLTQLQNKELKAEIKETITHGHDGYYEGYYESITAVKKSYVRLFLKIIKNSNGEVITGIGLVEDYTPTKKLETQLQQSQKMEAIGRLAGGIAHDFNNLLTIINGYSDMLLLSLNPNSRNYKTIKQIQDAGLRAASLTRQLLAFSRKQMMSPECIGLNELIIKMSDMLQRLIGEDIQLELKLCPDNTSIYADTTQIEQIILNLSANARDALPEGGHLIIETKIISVDQGFIQLHPEMDTGNHVLLSFTDNGIGMDESTKNQIFEPFFTTKESGKGTGLGLATVYGIIKQSKGHIFAYSESGEGTTFKIYFPLYAGKVTQKSEQKNSTTNFQGDETILIVEDESIIRDLIDQSLKEFGYNTIMAENGQKALEKLKTMKIKPALILTDVTMPEMSGKKLVQIVRALYPEIKVCYMSGYSNALLSKEHSGNLTEHFIQKPFSVHTLITTIRKILDS